MRYYSLFLVCLYLSVCYTLSVTVYDFLPELSDVLAD